MPKANKIDSSLSSACSSECFPHAKPCSLNKFDHAGTVHFCKECLEPLQSLLARNTWSWVEHALKSYKEEKWKTIKDSWPYFVALAVVSELSAALGSVLGQLVALGVVSLGLLLYLIVQTAVADIQETMYVCPLCRSGGGPGKCENDGTERIRI